MRRAALAVVAVAALATAGAAGALAASRDDEPEVEENVFVNPEGIIDANNSPTAVASPRDPRTVVVVNRLDRPGYSAALHVSRDGGGAWQAVALPLPAGLDRPFAPDVAFAPDGTLYVVYVNLQGLGNSPANLWLSRSDDGGTTLAPPVRVAGELTFQPRVVAGPGGRVHLTWLQGRDVGLLRLAGPPSPIVAASSMDGGRTFSEPVRVSDEARERVGAATPVLDGDGELVVLYTDFKGNRRDFENLEGPPWEEPSALVLTRSADGGRTFSAGVEVESNVVPGRRFLVFLPEFPALAAGPGGSLFVAWADFRNDDEDVFLRRSDDDGATWSDAVRVNDNPRGDGTSQYLPRVGVSGDGRVDVLFLDRRDDLADVMTRASLAWSVDGGTSFRNVAVSSAAFDSRIGPVVAPHLGVDFGTRLGLVSADDHALAVWTDTRAGTTDTGRQDIVAAAVRFPGDPSPVARWPIVGVALLVAGIAGAGWLTLGREKR